MKSISKALLVILCLSSGLTQAADSTPAELGVLARSKSSFSVIRAEQSITVPQNADFFLQRGDRIEASVAPVQTVDQSGTTIALNKESSMLVNDASTYEVLYGQVAVLYSTENPATILFNNLKISPEAPFASDAMTIEPIAAKQGPQPMMLIDAINQSEVQIFGMGETLLIAADNLQDRLATIPSGDYLRLAKNTTTGAWETIADVPEFLSAANTNNTQRTFEVVDERRFGFFWLNNGVLAGAGAAALVGGTILLLDDDDDNNDDDDDRGFSSPFFPKP